MTPYDFVCNIAKMRAKKGYSARLLSQLIDRDEAYINKLENLKINPSLSTIFEIISACDCSFEDTFLQHDCDADRELLELFHACSSESKDQDLRFARRRLFND